jgi:diguanylate cyclase (GGDEF)-like protein
MDLPNSPSAFPDSTRAAAAEIQRLKDEISRQESEIVRLRELCDTDPVTGVANRRRFDDEIHRFIALYHRLNCGFCLAVLDIDNFKLVNDRLGHTIGDRVLMTLAEALRQSLRSTDFVARIGGDEFAIILPGIGLDEAQHVLQRLHAQTEPLLADVCTAGPVAAAAARDLLPIRWSGGVAAMSGQQVAEQLLAAADAAMYDEKAAPR